MMLSVPFYYIAAIFIACSTTPAYSWVGQQQTITTTRPVSLSSSSELCGVVKNNDATTTSDDDALFASGASRRQLFKSAITTTAGVVVPLLLSTPSAIAASSSTSEDNIERRCDAADPRCGADGKLRSEAPKGKPIPRVTNKITHVVQLVIDVGERREEVGFIRFGLYGEDCPMSVRPMIEFLTSIGITGEISEKNKDMFENSIGMESSPVSILQGGIVPSICPGKAIEFGVPSQKKAFAKARGLRAAGDNFVPQNRPKSSQSEPSTRMHDVAGLISVPEKGIGYSTTGSDVDEAYGSAFLITADDDELFDTKLHRRVIGQVIDDESMEFLARLASLPIQKKGAGGNKGPPLLKVTVLDAGVQKVANQNANQNNNSKNSNKKKK